MCAHFLLFGFLGVHSSGTDFFHHITCQVIRTLTVNLALSVHKMWYEREKEQNQPPGFPPLKLKGEAFGFGSTWDICRAAFFGRFRFLLSNVFVVS